MATNLTQIKKGNVVEMDGKYFKVVDVEHKTPGNKGGIVTLKMRDLAGGGHVTKRFNSNDSLETAFLAKKSCQYLYPEGDTWVFMDNETYEQFNLGEDVVGDAMKYVPLNQDVQVNHLDDRPVEVDLPASVNLEVVEADPAIRGNTATNVTKRVVCETGLEVKAPQHIDVGDTISVDTRSGECLGRAKE